MRDEGVGGLRRDDDAGRAEELFAAALGLPPAERPAFLRRECAGDAVLHRELAELLSFAQEGAEFLASPILRPSVPDLAELFGAASDDAEPLPKEIGGYTITRVLGRGATSVVYEAWQREPSRPVAIKLYHPGPSSSTILSRFSVEAQLLARLDHPAIARLYEAGTEEVSGPHGVAFRLFFLVMEHVAGQRLDRWAEAPNRTSREILETFSKICDAVAHAHERGVLHRDLKPANILVTEEGHPKVLDFGIACAAEGEDADARRLTRTGDVLGSLAYMSPEQLSDSRRATERSDVYSLGVVLYRLLTGRLPFELIEGSKSEAAAKIRGGAETGRGTLPRPLPEDLERLVATAMASSPFDRYRTAADLASDVRRYLAHRPLRGRG